MTSIGRSENTCPFAGPLRLEAGRGDDQAAADAAGPPEDVAAGDRLGGLAQPHVVGQQQAARRQEPLDALALIRVKRSLQALECLAHLGTRSSSAPRAVSAACARSPAKPATPGHAATRSRSAAGMTLSKSSTSSSRRAGLSQ